MVGKKKLGVMWSLFQNVRPTKAKLHFEIVDVWDREPTRTRCAVARDR